MRLNFFGREVTITIDDKKINKKGESKSTKHIKRHRTKDIHG